MYQASLDTGSLPHITLQALVVSLRKPGRDSKDMAGYRPLSLLNTDYKILSKLLANRLQHYIPRLIHMDQCGFVPGRSTALNIRRLHQLTSRSKLHTNTQGCISLDLRQAFDSLHWNYIFRTLPKFGIPDNFAQWMELLYTNPTARARTGNRISQQYAVARVTRQGCPLSPLIFILALDPLLAKICTLAEQQGIRAGNEAHIVSVYADDIILYFENLRGNHTPIPTISKTFQMLSGLSINEAKSYAFSFTAHDLHVPYNLVSGHFNQRQPLSDILALTFTGSQRIHLMAI